MENKQTVIMAIDDEPCLLKVYELLFENQANVHFITGSSGDECLRLLKDVRPDVIMLDYTMPGISGEELVDRIKESDPSQKILLMSGHIMDSALTERVDMFISKPVGMGELKEAIHKLLQEGV